MCDGKSNCQSLWLYYDHILRLMEEAGVHRENHIVTTAILSILVAIKQSQIYLNSARVKIITQNNMNQMSS